MSFEPDDISRLYEVHAAELLRFLARRTLQAEVAVDLLAETFAQAFADRARFRGGDDDAALAWIFGIARHQLGRYFRRGRVERRALLRLGVQLPALSDLDYERIEELAGLETRRAAGAQLLDAACGGDRSPLPAQRAGSCDSRARHRRRTRGHRPRWSRGQSKPLSGRLSPAALKRRRPTPARSRSGAVSRSVLRAP